VQGGLAVLALPDMDPPQLNAVLRTLERTVLGGAKNKGRDGDTRKGEKRGPGGPREEGEEHVAQRPFLSPPRSTRHVIYNIQPNKSTKAALHILLTPLSLSGHAKIVRSKLHLMSLCLQPLALADKTMLTSNSCPWF
jgi:hypothetical protein